MKSIANFFLFFFYKIISLSIRGVQKLWEIGVDDRVDVVCISNYRDFIDILRFGFWNLKAAPKVLKWFKFRWGAVRGQLYMIAAITDDFSVSGSGNLERIRVIFVDAVREAEKSGAKVVLFAASTKRLFNHGELEKMFPNITFTIGDNFTGLLLSEDIKEVIRKNCLDLDKSKFLVIAPYGILGRVALKTLSLIRAKNIVILGNIERKGLVDELVREFGVRAEYSFDAVGVVDCVIPCSTSPSLRLNSEYVIVLSPTPKGNKLVVIDPCQPPNLPHKEFQKVKEILNHYDSGNAYCREFRWLLGKRVARILRLTDGVVFGCFAEASIISSNDTLWSHKNGGNNWYEVNEKKIDQLKVFFGDGINQFSLPNPTSFSQPISTEKVIENKNKPLSVLKFFL